MTAHLPVQIYDMLRNARFVHLATCKDNMPSASLMNFTLLEGPETFEGTGESLIVLATPEKTQKFVNIQSNPNVSLLVHDWVTVSASGDLAGYLQKLNQIELTQTSATLSGLARVAEGKEAQFYREKHLARHKDAECFIANSQIVLVTVTGAKLADSSNHVEQF